MGTPQDTAPKEEDVFGLGCAMEHFSEHKEVLEMIDNLKNIIGSKQSVTERAYERYVDILKQYCEQPHLLDAHLEPILDRIIAIIRDANSTIELKHATFQYMYFIINVRGYKVIVRHLPHEVADFEPVLRLLEAQDPTDSITWTTRYVLLLWLSIIVMIPFDMARLDGFEKDDDQSKTVMLRVLEVCKTYTTVPDKCRDAAAYLISKFLTRNDVKEKYLTEFIKWACDLSVSTESNSFVKYGTLSAVAMIIKHGKRDDILPHANDLLQWIINTEFKNHPGSNIQKLIYKIIQRIGLTFLPPRIVAWRYKRGNRSLAANLCGGDSTNNENSLNAAQLDPHEEVDIDVPEEMEEVLDQLIQGLRSGDSVVRWSAAKGVGRVTSRLTKDLGDDVVGSILELFSPREGDGAWHGGCLALAELGRRGLLLPHRLPEVVPVILKALVYDEPRGYSSVGSHIRDAACYVCWSFARAYETEDLKPFVNEIAAQLLIATCFDREINCRRAASAAFQENVGRQGTFPHGIDILTVADFFAVSIRNHSYLKISVYIAQFEEYTHKLIDHLVERKVIHWDLAIRELSASTLHNITALSPQYMIKEVLPNLFEKTKNIDLHCRHGSIITIGEILYALSKMCEEKGIKMEEYISSDIIDRVEELIPLYKERFYFKGLGGELMKEACSKFINRCSLSHMPFHGKPITDVWLSLLNECLSYNVETIQIGAASALPALYSEYYNGTTEKDKKTRQDIITKYIHEIKSETNQLTRMGHSMALGSLPGFFLKSFINEIIVALIQSANITDATLKWSESRRDAIEALTSIARTLLKDDDVALTEDHLVGMFECCLRGLTEYTQDKRGDIGAWVREASMNGLETLILLLVHKKPEILEPQLILRIVNGVVQQAVEKIDRTRAKAGRIFFSMIHNTPRIPHIPNHESLEKLLPKDEAETLNWYSASSTFPVFVNLIKFPEFTYHLILGFVCSVGGMTETLVKSSSHSLFNYLKSEEKEKGKREITRICNVIYKIFEDYQKNDRIIVPMFRFLDKLITSGCIHEVIEDPSSDFAQKTLKIIQMEITSCRDIYKLIDGINVLCQFIQVENEVGSSALFQLSVLLCNKHPYVRRSTSTKLFESLLIYGDHSVIPPENLDEITGLLSVTNWENPVEEVRPIRNTLCGLMGTKVPVLAKKKV